MTDTTTEFDTTYKLGRVMAKHRLHELHANLARLWQGTGGDGLSLRDLADEINVRVLERRMQDAGDDPIDGEAANAYSHLTGEETNAGVRIQQRRRLERTGIDVEDLESDFVSHQAVHTYLTEGLDLSTSGDEEDAIEKHERRVNKLRGRLAAVAEGSIADLASAGDLAVGDIECSVDLQVFCRDCGRQYELNQLFVSGGCDCDDTDHG